MASARNTFVVSVQGQRGPATVQEVRSGRRARLRSLRDLGAQIERWLQEAGQREAGQETGRAGMRAQRQVR